MLPFHYTRPKAVVCKALSWVDEGVASQFEEDIISFSGRASFGGGDLVWVVLESGLL